MSKKYTHSMKVVLLRLWSTKIKHPQMKQKISGSLHQFLFTCTDIQLCVAHEAVITVTTNKNKGFTLINNFSHRFPAKLKNLR